MLLQELNWATVADLSKQLPVVLPIAALEQHGHHLPLFTDSMLLDEIVRRADERLSQQVLVAPLMWLGNSHHHLDFAGTLSCEPRSYIDLLASLIDNLICHGFSRLLLLSGHGGNDVPGRQAVFEARQRLRTRDDVLLLSATYWSLAAPHETRDDFTQTQMGHACEWETSMMLRIFPHLVGDYRSAPAVSPGGAFAGAARGWLTQERSSAGHIGWPSMATAEKGEHLLEGFAQGVVRLIESMRDWDGKSWDAEEE